MKTRILPNDAWPGSFVIEYDYGHFKGYIGSFPSREAAEDFLK